MTDPARKTASVALICGPPKACTCPEVAWMCVCREGNVKRGCDELKPLPRDTKGRIRCASCDWFDWQHPASASDGDKRE